MIKTAVIRARVAGKMNVHAEEFKLSLGEMMDGRTRAPIARLSVAALMDIERYLFLMENAVILIRAVATKEKEHGSSQCNELPRAFSPTNPDHTLAEVIRSKRLQGTFNVFDGTYGLVPVVSVIIAAAKLFYTPTPSTSGLQLLQVAKELYFYGDDGGFNFLNPTQRLSEAFLAVNHHDAEADWNVATRDVVAAFAPTASAELSLLGDSGENATWKAKAVALVVEKSTGEAVHEGRARGHRQLAELLRAPVLTPNRAARGRRTQGGRNRKGGGSPNGAHGHHPRLRPRRGYGQENRVEGQAVQNLDRIPTSVRVNDHQASVANIQGGVLL
jgi:hypothetical protein